MKKEDKKDAILEWKNRVSKMGIVSIYCKSSRDLFLKESKDIDRAFNSDKFQLEINRHSNKLLQELWNIYGKNDFEFKVEEVLKFKDTDNMEEKLENLSLLMDKYLNKNIDSKKL